MGYGRKVANQRAARAKAARRGHTCPHCGRTIKGEPPVYWDHLERCGRGR